MGINLHMTTATSETNSKANGVASDPHVAARSQYAVPQRRGSSEYDTLLGRLLRQHRNDGPGRFVGLTSSHRKAGVSTIAANLAIRAADHHVGPVLVVDANTERPYLHRTFRANRGPGLREVLAGTTSFDNAIQGTRVAELSLMALGKKSNALVTPALAGAFEALSQELRERFSMVVVDFPTGDSISQWTPLLRECDSLLMVVASRVASSTAAKLMQEQLAVDGVTLTGAVLNRHKQYTPRWLRRNE
jgi:tyrosine-protein kinase Etk/Wzc